VTLFSCYFWKLISFYCLIALVLLFLFHFQIGEVVDGPEDGMKRPVLDGFEYDYGQCLYIGYFDLICLGFVVFSYSLNLIHPTVYIDGLLILLSVFDVDIGDGEPIRKLPYNRSGEFLLLPFECL